MVRKVANLLMCMAFPLVLMAQKTQTVTVRPTTSTVDLKVKNGQKVVVTINGKAMNAAAKAAPIVDSGLRYKTLGLSPWKAVTLAASSGKDLVIDTMDVVSEGTTDEEIPTTGKLVVRPETGKRAVIRVWFRAGQDKEKYLFRLGNGSFKFINCDFVCMQQSATRGGSCITTEQGETTYNIDFKNCTWSGEWKINVQSSAGHGRVFFDSCALYAYAENIQYYGQAGTKKLIMFNTTLHTKESHNIYQHPWISDSLVNVTSLGSGKLAMNNYCTTCLPFKAAHKVYINCRNAPEAKALVWNTAPMWRLQGDKVIIANSDLPTYEWRGDFTITNTNIVNAGNGVAVYGTTTATNCTGAITAMSNLVLNSCNMTSISGNAGSTLTVNGGSSTFNYLSGTATYNNVAIGDVDAYTDNKTIFKGCTFKPQYKTIRAYKGGASGIKFVGKEFPIASF